MCKLWPSLEGQVTTQVSLNDPTSHHLFATLRPRQSQSRWPSALKLIRCNEPIWSLNLNISDFFSYIGDLCSGQFLDLPIVSQWGKNQVAHFSQITVLIVIATSIIDDISLGHPVADFIKGRKIRPAHLSKHNLVAFYARAHTATIWVRKWPKCNNS